MLGANEEVAALGAKEEEGTAVLTAEDACECAGDPQQDDEVRSIAVAVGAIWSSMPSLRADDSGFPLRAKDNLRDKPDEDSCFEPGFVPCAKPRQQERDTKVMENIYLPTSSRTSTRLIGISTPEM